MNYKLFSSERETLKKIFDNARKFLLIVFNKICLKNR